MARLYGRDSWPGAPIRATTTFAYSEYPTALAPFCQGESYS